MKPAPTSPPPQPLLLDALDAAIADGGTAALDPDVPEAVWIAALVGPAAAFLVRPGKDVRARLVRAGWLLGGGAPDDPRCAAIARAIELIHAGSLIVDDVEDASDERRGAPALHRIVGEPLAINTGSWMYFWALDELAQLAIPGALERAVAALRRCHQGQALDLATLVIDLEQRSVPAVVAATTRLKTGALCRLAMELGALGAGATPERLAATGALGEATGCALQMLDDLGCVLSVERRPKACEDLRAGRPTWAWAWLAEQADPFAWARLSTLARGVLAGDDTVPLIEALAERIAAPGRARVHAALVAAVDALRAAVPDPDAAPVIDAIARDLAQMEAMYG